MPASGPLRPGRSALRKARVRRPSKPCCERNQPRDARGERVPRIPRSLLVPVAPKPADGLVVAPVPMVDVTAGAPLCTAVPAFPLLPVMLLPPAVPAVVLAVVLALAPAVDALAELPARSALPAVELVNAPPDSAPLRALLEAALSLPPAQPTIAVTSPAITANVHLFIPHLSLSRIKRHNTAILAPLHDVGIRGGAASLRRPPSIASRDEHERPLQSLRPNDAAGVRSGRACKHGEVPHAAL